MYWTLLANVCDKAVYRIIASVVLCFSTHKSQSGLAFVIFTLKVQFRYMCLYINRNINIRWKKLKYSANFVPVHLLGLPYIKNIWKISI